MSELALGSYLGLDTMNDPSDSNKSRIKKARTEPKLVVPFIDEYGYATGKYLVISDADDEDPSMYEINMDSKGGREDCDCMDMVMNNPNSGCKHIQRIGLHMTEGNLPNALKREPDHAEEYMDWLKDQRAALEEKKAELEQDGLTDSDPLRRVNRTLDSFEVAFNRVEDAIEEEEEGSVVSAN
jgi:hypothetical protein